MKILKNIMITRLESIVATRAIGSAIITNIAYEFPIDACTVQLLNFNVSIDTIILSISMICIYSQAKIMQSKIIQLNSVNIYNSYGTLIKNILLTFFLIFSRNVEIVL
jgi:hypothetical protein